MSRQSEKALRELLNYIETNRSESPDDEELSRLTRQFSEQRKNSASLQTCEEVPLCADDYLDFAENSENDKEKIKYIKKALSLEPDNLDAGLMLAATESKSFSDFFEAVNKLAEKGTQLMEEGGYFKNHTGDFWPVLETRPYMRILSEKFHILIQCGMMRAAAKEGWRMIELNNTDNLGIRYDLMHIFAMLEDEPSALKLAEKFSEHDESSMLLPMVVMYYKLCDFDRARECLERLQKINKDTKKYFDAVLSGKVEKYIAEMAPFGYRPFTIEELLIVTDEHEFLYMSSPEFFLWANSILKKKKSDSPKVADTKPAVKKSGEKAREAKKSGAGKKTSKKK